MTPFDSMKAIGICLLLLILPLSACQAPEDDILNSLGEYKHTVYYSEGEFQDYTDYAKYYYDNVSFTGNAYFTKVNHDDSTKLAECLDDFEAWIDTYRKTNPLADIVIHYDFDRNIIDGEDYIYIDSEKYTTASDDGTTATSLVNYEVYFFDWQTQILYYFHSNI